jgi:23S rRNA pseudouridine1911/1915/1917 synthase
MEEKNVEEKMLEYVVSSDYDGERLDKYISQIDDTVSRSFFQKLIKDGNVLVNGIPQKANYRLSVDDVVSVSIPPNKELEVTAEDIPLDILYEDDDILIVNKPKGMVVHPAPGHDSGTLVNAVLFHCKDSLSGISGVNRPGIVHRIDMDTTGSLIICKNDNAHLCVADQLREHSIRRIYEGIVFGNLKEDEGCIRSLIGRDPKDRKKMSMRVTNGKEAVTHFTVLERFGDYTYVQFQLETGRTHQIRVHMSGNGHPLLGDLLYGPAKQPFSLQGQTLHAKTIGFRHPSTGEYVEFEAPVPEYFSELLMKLRNRN